jgi:hypothetical protein
LPALDQQFAIAEILRVSRGVSFRGFPEFPRAGMLMILDPPCAVAEGELTKYAIEVRTARGPVVLDYQFWQVNSDQVIGLLFAKLDEAAIPLRSSVTFLRRKVKKAK